MVLVTLMQTWHLWQFDFLHPCCAKVVSVIANALALDSTNEWLQSIHFHQHSNAKLQLLSLSLTAQSTGFASDINTNPFIFFLPISRWITAWHWHRKSIWMCNSLNNQCIMSNCIYNTFHTVAVLNAWFNIRI